MAYLTYFSRGLAKSDLEDKYGAIADYTESIRLNPKNAGAYYYRGLQKYVLRDKQGGLRDLQEAARLYQQKGNTLKYKETQDLIRKIEG